MKPFYPIAIPGHVQPQAERLHVHSPYSGEPLAEVELVDEKGIERALSIVRQTFAARHAWLPVYRRVDILHALAQKIAERHDQLALLIAREGGKPLRDACIEVARAATTVRLGAEEAGRIHGEQIPMAGNPMAQGRLAFTIREPIGPVLAVSAFNHPLNLVAHLVAPAIAAGCPVLIKPALKTPLSCLTFVELLYDAGLPQEWALAIPCSDDLTAKAAASDQIAFVNFIGSARVGWQLRARLAPGVRCALEHGGAAPVIIEKDADLDRAIPLLVKGGFYHAGQVCVSVQRIFAHRDIADEVISKLLERVATLKVGDPTDAATDVGPLIRATEVDRIDAWIAEARQAGATVACGGKKLPHQCYAPTVLVDPPLHTRVMTDEVFGPVVCVYRYDALEEAITYANGVPWAFQAAIISRSVNHSLSAAHRLNASAVMINDHTAFRIDEMPFGGRGQSGLGTGGVPYSIRELTQEKLIVVNQ